MNQFERIRLKKPKSSVFNMSHEKKLTLNMGDLVPIFMQETLPGDKFRVNTEILLRLQPLISPVMHRVNVYTHFFFVPYRLIWNEWEKFITGGEHGTAEPVFPTFDGKARVAKADFFKSQSLGDYFGIPFQQLPNTGDSLMPSISQLPFRAYQLIWNEYYRDQNLQDKVAIPLSSGSLDYETDEAVIDALTGIKRRAWEKDYFTSALPFTQRGNEVKLPLVGDIDVTGRPLIKRRDTGLPLVENSLWTNEDGYLSSNNSAPLEITEGLYGNLEDSNATTVNELRRAFVLQRWMEKMARGGSRYVEQMLHMFGVTSSDARLQRPEYIGGGKLPVQISEVLQTSQSEETGTPQANMAGHGFTAGINNGFTRYFEEHGLVIGIMSVLPRTAYMQGLPKFFLKKDRFDWYWPEFAHIGEQEVDRDELYLNTSLPKTAPFGYQRRYCEYTQVPDSVHGEMRTSLKHWHLAREFDTVPSLNSAFVTSNPDTRIFAVESEEWSKLICQLYFDFKAIRPVSKYGEPI